LALQLLHNLKIKKKTKLMGTCRKCGDHPSEDLAKSGYKFIKKKSSFYIFEYNNDGFKIK
jgi:hypothetical protein